MGNIHGYNIGIVINIYIWIYMNTMWEIHSTRYGIKNTIRVGTLIIAL